MARYGSRAGNLSGLLGSIGSTIGEMGQPGQQYIDTFRRQQAPTPEMDSSESLADYAKWARRNGYDEEADRYMALAYKQKEVEKQQARDKQLGEAMADASRSGSIAIREGERGDLGNVDATISSLNSRLSDPAVQANPDAVKAITSQVQRLENMRPEFQAANTEAIARGVVNIDRQIAALDKSDPNYEQRKAGLESARARFMDQEDVEETYQLKKLELMEIENRQNSAMWTQQSSAVIAELKNAGTDPSKIAAVEAKYPQYAAQIAAVSPEILAQNETLAKIRADDFRIESLPSEIDNQRNRIAESNLTDAQKADLNSSLDAAENLVNGGQVYKPAAIESYAKVVSRIDQMMNQELAAEAGVERQRTERAVIAHEKAKMVQVTEADARELASQMTDKDINDLTGDEITNARNTLLEEAAEWEFRTAVAAGRAEPRELDSDDKKVLTQKLKNGDYGEEHDPAVRLAAFDLTTQGYSKEEVTAFLTKELPEMTADRAEALYDDMWEDLNSVDEAVPTPAEVKADPYRKEQGLPFLKPMEERYEEFLHRRSQTVATRPPSGPSVAQRQRDRLSPPIGPMGNPEDYNTDLRKARENQPNSPYRSRGGEQVASEPYINPRYRLFGG